MATTTAPELAAQLDRLPMTSAYWMLVTLVSMSGWFSCANLFLTAYVAPGLVKAGVPKAEVARHLQHPRSLWRRRLEVPRLDQARRDVGGQEQVGTARTSRPSRSG